MVFQVRHVVIYTREFHAVAVLLAYILRHLSRIYTSCGCKPLLNSTRHFEKTRVTESNQRAHAYEITITFKMDLDEKGRHQFIIKRVSNS